MLSATREEVKNRDDPGTCSLVAKVAGPRLDLWNGRAPLVIDAGSQCPFLRRTADGRALWLAFLVMQDAGMRPVEVFAIRLEDIHWADRRIWIPSGESAKTLGTLLGTLTASSARKTA